MRYFLLLFISLLFLVMNSYGQVKFEPGYIFDLEGNKTTCLIKNVDWKNNPTAIEYKIDAEAKPVTATLDEISVFEISGLSKYVRAMVDIDRSSDQFSKLSAQRQPEFTKEVLFLKTLIEGEASLYCYEEGNLTRFFFNTANLPIQQLVYKTYASDVLKVGTNNMFRQQLWTSVRCAGMDEREVEDLGYHQRELIKYFISYNTCRNVPYEDFKFNKEGKGSSFHLKLKSGVDYSTVKIRNDYYKINDTFDKVISPRFGLEFSYVLPFNKNKWAIIAEPTFQSYSQSQKLLINFSNWSETTANVTYTSIELPMGVRHSLYMSDVSTIFVNVFLVFDLEFDSSVDLNNSYSMATKTNFNISGGAGYEYRRLGAEIRYSSPRQLLTQYAFWSANYSKLSLIFGYRLL